MVRASGSSPVLFCHPFITTVPPLLLLHVVQPAAILSTACARRRTSRLCPPHNKCEEGRKGDGSTSVQHFMCSRCFAVCCLVGCCGGSSLWGLPCVTSFSRLIASAGWFKQLLAQSGFALLRHVTLPTYCASTPRGIQRDGYLNIS